MKLNVNSPAYVLAFAAVTSSAFTAAIMALYAAGEPTARRSAALYEQRALVKLFGLQKDTAGRHVAGLVDSRIAGYRGPTADPADLRREPIFLDDPQTGQRIPLLVAYREDLPADRKPDLRDRGRILGYAVPVSGVGFWAQITGYLAVSADMEKVLGVVFLRHSETPGLGGRITEPAWREQFRGLKITPPAKGDRFLYIGGQKPSGRDSPRAGRHVDAITGATGTSTAVDKFLNDRIAQFRRAAEAAGLVKGGKPHG